MLPHQTAKPTDVQKVKRRREIKREKLAPDLTNSRVDLVVVRNHNR
jgi:hypothetical protein